MIYLVPRYREAINFSVSSISMSLYKYLKIPFIWKTLHNTVMKEEERLWNWLKKMQKCVDNRKKMNVVEDYISNEILLIILYCTVAKWKQSLISENSHLNELCLHLIFQWFNIQWYLWLFILSGKLNKL